MSDRSNKKTRTGPGRTRRKRNNKDKPIRLEDLIPKNDVSGGKRLVFGATNGSLDEPRKKKEN